MSFLRVTVDEIEVATVDTRGRDVVSIRVGGTRVDDDYADLGVTGGVYDHEATTDHRIWIDQMPLRIGQVVGVAFVEEGVQTGQGRTIAELYPGQSEARTPSPADRVELAGELRRTVQTRLGYQVRLVLPDGRAATLTTESGEHGFGFGVLWNRYGPDRMRVSLYSYTLESIAAKVPGRHTVRETFPLGSAVRLELLA